MAGTNKITLTEEQEKWLRRAYKRTKKEVIMERLGLTKSTLYRLAKDMGLARDNKPNPHRIRLTEEQEKYLTKHYKHTDNGVLAERLGISHSTLHRFARAMGLKKTRQYVRKTNAKALEKAAEWREDLKKRPTEWREHFDECIKHARKNQTTCFKKGESNKDRLTPERFAEAQRKRVKTWLATRDKERARYIAGLPLKTNFKPRHLKRLTPEIARRYKAKYYLRTEYGYITQETGLTVYYDENTRRTKMEEQFTRRYRLKFEPYGDKERKDVKLPPDWRDKTGGFNV